MAFEISSNTLVRPYEYVSRTDPSLLEHTDEEWEVYLDRGEGLKLKGGGKPTVFRLQHLRGRARERMEEVRRLMAGFGMAEIQERLPNAFYHACELGLVGWEGVMNDKGGEVQFLAELDSQTGIRHASDASMALLQDLDPSLPYEIGSRIWRATYLSPK